MGLRSFGTEAGSNPARSTTILFYPESSNGLGRTPDKREMVGSNPPLGTKFGETLRKHDPCPHVESGKRPEFERERCIQCWVTHANDEWKYKLHFLNVDRMRALFFILWLKDYEIACIRAEEQVCYRSSVGRAPHP